MPRGKCHGDGVADKLENFCQVHANLAGGFAVTNNILFSVSSITVKSSD
ncbi:hypothetical protein SpAn4DRAFT_3193 [Sporomusa ovata]|uniref:Uncharacterized protein n=1 Tax=Sporomusa ovata TaxID=2378 RepID=A0A0U1L0Q3_9FIRM|nr:hypothetical protein SpAn4DRAFT_3193 [Sporomusa ovata]